MQIFTSLRKAKFLLTAQGICQMPFQVLLLRKEFVFRPDVLYARSTGYERYFTIRRFCTRLAMGNNNIPFLHHYSQATGRWFSSFKTSFKQRLRMAQGFQSPQILKRKCSLLFRGVSVLGFDLEQAKKLYGKWLGFLYRLYKALLIDYRLLCSLQAPNKSWLQRQ